MRAMLPSFSSTSIPVTVSIPPKRKTKCVGDQSVTSWPKIRCQTSSSASADRPKLMQTTSSTAPIGTRQPSVMRTQAGVASSWSAMPNAITPAANVVKIPSSSGQCPGFPSGPVSRPLSTW